jgi:phage tail sheath protein FI
VACAAGQAGALEAAIDALAPVADLDLIAVPDAMALADEASILRVQGHAVAHCAAQGDRLAILDALRGSNVDRLMAQRDEILRGQAEPVSAALYHPWLITLEGRAVPPSGAVAGIFADTDATIGVHKAPANQEVQGVRDLEIDIDTGIQDRLNPAGINCLRAFPGRGIRVWGARTISRDPVWRYVNVRRLVLTLRRWIALEMAWAGFEPNGPRLWNRIERELRAHLTQLWNAGALSGATANAAFYVKCDAETNPPERRDGGEVVTEIGLAPSPPAELVVIRVTQREGVADLLPR